jgi:5-methylcytosine-specific restriction endonuclease McrA
MTEQRRSARERGYDTKWQKERGAFLAQPENQFCERCKAAGILNAGHLRMDGSPQTNPKRMHLVVNHRIPHRGDKRLFWDKANWEVACPDHHDIRIKQEEAGTFKTGTDATGRPIDPNHAWNKAIGR